MSMPDRRRRWLATFKRSLDTARRWRPHNPDSTSADGDGSGPAAIGIDALSELFRDAPFGFAVLDDHGRYCLVNQRFAAADGVPASHYVGRRPAELPLTKALDGESVERVLRTGQPGRATNTTVPDPASGVERHLMTSCYPVRDQSGRV